MKQEKKSRREALGMIGKAGICLGTGPVFFTSLRIHPDQGAGLGKLPSIREKAVISGSGTKLIIIVNGKPGRNYSVAVAGSDIIANYRRLPGATGVLDKAGSAEAAIDITIFENARIFLRIITADDAKFSSKYASTEAFIVNLAEGGIKSFEGVLNRPISGESRGVPYICVLACVGSPSGKYRLK